MNIETYENIKRDLSSFADDELDMICDMQGNFMFERHGQVVKIKIKEDDEGRLLVEYNNSDIPYKTFLAKELARLDVLATKIIQRSSGLNELYVDPCVIWMNMDQHKETKATDVLCDETSKGALVGTKISFVTADAGHGKSMLLHQFQHLQAHKYLNGQTKYLFWHIDLHGRDLVRLNEAIMYELGELRISGLYYSSILTLMRNHLIVLGIDGFDELAAEKGGETALNSLSSLVSQMQGRGVLIAASRRAFFNSQDYLKRTGILRQNLGYGCVFNEIKIKNWRREQCSEYLKKYTYSDGEYSKLLSLLKSESHPLLERPYLFTKLVGYSYDDAITPSEFVGKRDGGTLDSINGVIEAFIDREVDKWTHRDKETGKPYLNFDQHVRLLSELALDMWSGQKNIISVENIQLILTILFEEWKISSQMQPLILRMVESHAMLLTVEGRDDYRRFDHEEFKNFFLSRALFAIISEAIRLHEYKKLYKFLYVAQLPDAVAQYLATLIDKNDVSNVFDALMAIKKNEWKPSYIQSNIGTLLPYLLNGYDSARSFVIEDKVNFTSLVFENKSVKNLVFKKCYFVNISFKNTKMTNVRFEGCTFTGISIDNESENVFTDVYIADDCDINMVSLFSKDGDDVYTEYSPLLINLLLAATGFSIGKEYDKSSISYGAEMSDFYKMVKRLLNKYSKTTSLYESNIRQSPQYNFKNPDVVINEIIPLLEKYEIVERKENKKTKQAGTQAWVLKKYEISEIFRAEDNPYSDLWQFWEEVRNHS